MRQNDLNKQGRRSQLCIVHYALCIVHLAFCIMPCALCIVMMLASCSELKDDDHYGQSDSQIANDELKIVDMTSEDYMKSRSDLSGMNSLFQQQGIYDELHQKGQLSTLLVVTNDHFQQPTEKTEFITRSHVSDISISPANLEDGTRLMMWHGKYVNVSIDDLGKEGNIIDHILFNNGAVKEVVKTTTGYIYVISDMIQTPTSLKDYIDNLPDDYSIFREMVLASGGKEFDRANSKTIGINEQGNTVYDSVFIYTNTFFDAVDFDMNSESLTATMLLPSNRVIEEALADVKARLEKWQATDANLGHRNPASGNTVLQGCNDSIVRQWILEAAFYRKKYTPAEMVSTDVQDLSSIYSRQWRTNIQQVDTQNPVELSNGVVYNVTKLHIPNNVVMYRLKDYFYYYENCTSEQKEQYFRSTNLTFNNCNTDVDAWTPWAGVWPLHQNRIIQFNKTSGISDSDGFRLDFTLIKLNADEGTVSPFRIPPGSYRLAMGSVQNAGFDVVCTFLADGQEVAKSPVRTWGTSTAYHYDRGTTLPNRHAEGYNSAYVREMGGSSKADNYDTDGGLMMDEVTIPDLKGDGSAVQVILRIDCYNWAGKSNVKLHHWCLRPTENNY